MSIDSEIEAAARALAVGDPLAALDRVALRDDPDGFALRGIAMAQLGEFHRAQELLHRAAQGFEDRDPLAWARCIAAKAEVALAVRDLRDVRALASAIEVFERKGDRTNATYARVLRIRYALWLGQPSEAASTWDALELALAPPMLKAMAELVRAQIAIRTLDARAARAATISAMTEARRAGIPSLIREVEGLGLALGQTAARVRSRGEERGLRLDEVQMLLDSPVLVIDGCRRLVALSHRRCSLVRRPVLFELVDALAEAWPNDAPRERLIVQAFGASQSTPSLRVRLRVEIGRLRQALTTVTLGHGAPLATIDATAAGFVLKPLQASDVVRLRPAFEGEHATVLALLGDGVAWSTSALALALGVSQRTVQRSLANLQASGRVHALNRGRTQKWLALPVPEITTALLLPMAWEAR